MKSYALTSTLDVSAKTGNHAFSGLSPVVTGLNHGPVATLAHAFSMVDQFRRDGIPQPITIKLMDEVTGLHETIRVAPIAKSFFSEAAPLLSR